MNLLATASALLCSLLPPPLQDDAALGEKKVQVKEGWFYKGPSRLSGLVRKAEDGEDVTVTAVEGRFSKVTVKKNGVSAYILSVCLIAKEKFARSAADEAEGKKLAAQGLEGQRGLNPETEKEYRSQGGAAIEKSYQDLDGLMARPAYRGDRAELERRLKEFRQSGKLGEFASVK